MGLHPWTSSGTKNASAVIIPMPGKFGGVDIIPPTTGNCTLTVWDSANSTTSGKLIIAEFQVDSGQVSLNHDWLSGVVVNQGIYCEFTQDIGNDGYYLARYSLG